MNSKTMSFKNPDKVFEEIKSQYNDDTEILDYLNQIDEKTKLAFLIAKDHLKSSFNLTKSNGYVSYNKK
tara:strand:- start:171 stop:377 length:207 start_codon:yes stop_codon:yes gene_type:complete